MTKALVALRSRLVTRDRGATAVEYALLVALIAAIIAIAVAALGTQISSIFDTVRTRV